MAKIYLKMQNNYSYNNNFELTHFKMSENFHFSTCLSEKCLECAFHRTLKNFAF